MIGLHALLACALILPFGSQSVSGCRAALDTLHQGAAEIVWVLPTYVQPEGQTPSNAPQESRENKSSKTDASHVVLQGRVSCLDPKGQPIADGKECSEPFRLVLHSQEGATFSFVSTDALAPMLADSRVRQRLLRITAVKHADGQLETLTVQSIKDGKVYDIYYFCQVCNITTYTPGPCPCCRQELEFKEAPAVEP
jgi:rubrerythrin